MNGPNKFGSLGDFDRSQEVLRQTHKYLKSEQSSTLTKEEVVGLTSKKTEQFQQQRIQIFMDRLSQFFRYPRNEKAEAIDKHHRRVEKYKSSLVKRFVIKEADIPSSAYELDQRIAEERGHGFIETSEQYISRKNQEIMDGQVSSLSEWIDYLTGPDSYNAPWFKYVAMRSIITMGELDKQKWTYDKRSNSTVKPFPELNSEVLGVVENLMVGKLDNETITSFTPQETEQLDKLISKGSFKQLYALAQKKYEQANNQRESLEDGEEMKGIWKKYPREEDGKSEYLELNNSLKGYNTGWCTATSASTAQSQLQGGDFYVYYRADKNGEFKIPKIAIRMEDDYIGEVRGTGPYQEMDADYSEVIIDFAKDLGGYDVYLKKSHDMKLITLLIKKDKIGEELTKEEVIFLYEIESNILGFGRREDPRIKKLRSTRDSRVDFATLFEVNKESIITDLSDLKPDSIAFYSPSAEDYFSAANSEVVNPKFYYNLYLAYNSKLVDSQTFSKTVISQKLYKRLFTDGLIRSEDIKLIINSILSNKDLKNIKLVRSLMQSPNTTNQDIELLLNSLTTEEASLVIPYSDFEDAMLVGIYNANVRNIKPEFILSHKNLTSASISSIIQTNPQLLSNKEVLKSVLENKNTPQDILLLIEELSKDGFKSEYMGVTFRKTKITELLQHPNYPIDKIKTKSEHMSGYDLVGLGKNPNLDQSTIDSIQAKLYYEADKIKFLHTLATHNSDRTMLGSILDNTSSMDKYNRREIFLELSKNPNIDSTIAKNIYDKLFNEYPALFRQYTREEYVLEEIDYDYAGAEEDEYEPDPNDNYDDFEIKYILTNLIPKFDTKTFESIINTFFYNHINFEMFTRAKSMSSDKVTTLINLYRQEVPETFAKPSNSDSEITKLKREELVRISASDNISPEDFERITNQI
jgi:hypothetical protein